ncbi:hypothetical protein ACSMCT_23320, partial [Salmonella enterica]
DRAESIAKAVDGVKSVKNDLKVQYFVVIRPPDVCREA